MHTLTCPGNGIYVLQGEMAIIITAMRREARWSSHLHQDEDQDPLIRSFSHLKDTLNQIDDLFELDPNTYLGPFLEVIRSIKTTGPVTSLALSSVNKFLSYGLIAQCALRGVMRDPGRWKNECTVQICEHGTFSFKGSRDPNGKSVATAVENIASAVTRAKFVGTDQASDGVVLMKILQVLRTLMVSPEGVMLTNEIVCEIMKSCFRLCFETRLSELLRRTAEHCLKDMVQLLFTRLPQFAEDFRVPVNMKKLKMRTESMNSSRNKRKSQNSIHMKHNRMAPKLEDSTIGRKVKDISSSSGTEQCGEAMNPVGESRLQTAHLATTPTTSGGNIVDMQGTIHQGSLDPVDAASAVDSGIGVPIAAPHLSEPVDSEPVRCSEPSKQPDVLSPDAESSNLSSCVVINVELESSGGGESPGLSSKVGSVEDVNIQEKVTADRQQSQSESSQPEQQHLQQLQQQQQHPQQLDLHDPQQQQQQWLEQLQVPEGLQPVFPESCDMTVACEQHLEVLQDGGASLQNSSLRDETSMLSRDTELGDMKVESHPLEESHQNKDYVNPRGVRFTSEEQRDDGSLHPLVPYGLVCVRELFQFLVSLCNPLDKQNNETMVHLGLTLLTVALEVGADSIGRFGSLLGLVKDELCRNLFSLLNSERLSIFAADLQVCFLLFESLRTHLKFQLETYLTKLIDIIISDSPKIPYEQKEIALESVVQLWRIPGLVTELYLNYDCDLYCPNLFEDLTKLLSKNAFPVTGLYNTHLLSLDALLTIIDSIEAHCHSRILCERQEGQANDAQKEAANNGNEISLISIRRSARQKISDNIPSHEQLMAIKRKKKLLSTGTEHFNVKPKKGIQFLQEHRLLSTPLDATEVVHFLRENPRLDKKMIGEFISNRSNLQVLDCFVKSFDFTDLRIDEALRLYLETFRLPGEAPLISVIMEHFAEHWHKCNGEPLANADAAFTLAYAVIMLNVDQHNYNVKKQSNPMTLEEFKKNLKNVNGGEDFNQEMLDNIYKSIKNEEIVMPAEQTGLVRENYLWKVLLRRGAGRDGVFVHAPNGLYDHDLFSLIWGPTVAALSFVFDKSSDATIYQKAISGFRKCAMISAHYGMSNDFDNLVISLCKFTTLLNSTETPDNLTISFGANPKAQLAAKTVFTLAHRHGDILREGWKNVLDCLLQLFRCKLLPKTLVEAEDFIEQNGKISLLREETPSQKTETGLLSSIYSYIALASEPSNQKAPSLEDQKHIQQAQMCVRECHLEQLITESKFLRIDSLQELVRALILASHGPDGHLSGSPYDEDVAVFFLELLLKVVIQNRDRVNAVWQGVRDHIYSLMMGAAACDYHFLLERSVVGLLRLAIRLMRREDMSPVVLQSLRMLLLLKSAVLFRVSRQVAYGLYELLKTSAANIHSDSDWAIIFSLLECVGAGALPPRVVGDTSKPSSDTGTAKSDGELPREEDSGLGNERGYTSDSELSKMTASPRPTSPELSPNTGGGWILVGREGEIQPLQVRPVRINQYSIVLERELSTHDPYGLVKCCESLAFLVRDVAHITPYNFENCIHCIRTFVEASLNGTNKLVLRKSPGAFKDLKPRRKSAGGRRKEEISPPGHTRSPRDSNPYDADESDSEELPSGYHQVSIQLLDLMHTLHTRTAQIFKWWAEESGDPDFTSLWARGWCPLLQGIARLCCDSRKQVRTSAVTYLQRALLVHDLQTLSAHEWEGCFNKVLFPLLEKLLEPLNPSDPLGLEETRMRAATVLCKVFLHHLTPLQSLPTFTALWLTILYFMDKYMHADKSDLLSEAIPESLKNMLLVMDSAGVFSTLDGYNQLWSITWDRIHAFLPSLKEELFRSHPVDTALRPTSQEESAPGTSVQADLCIHPIASESPSAAPVAPEFLASAAPAPALSRIHSTPVFTHLGQQMMSTAIGAPAPPPSLVPVEVESPKSPLSLPLSESSHSSCVPLFISATNNTGAVPSYSAYTVQSSSPSFVSSDGSAATKVFPAHYFYPDPQHAAAQQVFPVSVPAQSVSSSPPTSNTAHLFLGGAPQNVNLLPCISPVDVSEQSLHNCP